MIEINLLPGELKVKSKKLPHIETKYLFYLIPLVLGILIFIHIYLFVIGIAKNCQFAALNNKWQQLAPQKKALEEAEKGYELLSADAKMMQQLTSQRIIWSEKLNKLSLNLPSGVWLNEVKFTPKEFILTGSVVSLEKEEITLINKFMANLKNDTGFFKDFANLELNSVQKKTVGAYEIADFVLTGTLKQK